MTEYECGIKDKFNRNALQHAILSHRMIELDNIGLRLINNEDGGLLELL